MALIKQSDLEARLGRILSSEEELAFPVINNAMQAHVERIIGASIENASESTRYFDGGQQHLTIDPCTAISAVKQVDDDLVAVYTYDTTDYTTEPANRTLKWMLRHRSGAFARGINNISVTAKFSVYGDASVLATVKQTMLDALVSELGNTDNITKESIEGYSVEYASTQSKNALESLRYLFPGV